MSGARHHAKGGQKVPGRLSRVVVENFKSYSGVQVLGPFTDFTCIVGPNGAGAWAGSGACFARGTFAWPFVVAPLENGQGGADFPRFRCRRCFHHSFCFFLASVGRHCRSSVSLPSRLSAPSPPGKSNVMDAISFVLGMSGKGIRADKLSDLIFKVEGAPAAVR